MAQTKRWGWIAAILAGLFFLQAQVLAEKPGESPKAKAPKAKYVGVDKCRVCHKSKAKGDQFGKWKQSKHAQAYAVLGTEKAKAIAKKMGIADPQKSDKCLKCHVTAHGVDPSLIVPAAEGKKGYKKEDGVGCESCHGPGSLYKSRKVMKDHEAALAKGLIVPDEKLCRKCHNEESPTYQAFDFEKMWAAIQHPNPKKKKAAPAGK